MSWECLQRNKEGGEAHILEVQKRDVEEKGAKDGTYLIMKKVLLKLEPEVKNSVQRNNFFRTTCKTKDRVCKVIIDGGRTDNLLSTYMVENLELETIAHTMMYKVT
jgi:hypothetical protein